MKRIALLLFMCVVTLGVSAQTGSGFLKSQYKGKISANDFVSIMTAVVDSNSQIMDQYLVNLRGFGPSKVRECILQHLTALKGRNPTDRTQWVTKDEAKEMIKSFTFDKVTDPRFWNHFGSGYITTSFTMDMWTPKDSEGNIRVGDIIALYGGVPAFTVFCFNPLFPTKDDAKKQDYDQFDETKPLEKLLQSKQGNMVNYNHVTITIPNATQAQQKEREVVYLQSGPQVQAGQQQQFQQQAVCQHPPQGCQHQQYMMPANYSYQAPPQQQAPIIIQQERRPGIGGYLLSAGAGYLLGRFTGNNQGYYYNQPMVQQPFYPQTPWYPQYPQYPQYPDFQGPTGGGLNGYIGNNNQWGNTGNGNNNYSNSWDWRYSTQQQNNQVGWRTN